MSRTHRHYLASPNLPPGQKRKAHEPLKRSYLRHKQRGHEDPGDYCPDCGDPTGFQSGFLVCNACGWIDSGTDSIKIDFNAA